jgi:hypothetical protein
MYCRPASEFDENDILGIAITKTQPDQNHLAIAYHDGTDAKIIHLVWHRKLVKSCLTDKYSWVEPISLDSVNRIHLAAHCESIFELNHDEGIPYGPCGGGEFDPSGYYIGKLGSGLTCSSFVIEIFKSQGIKLINENDWAYRDTDANWQKEILISLQDERFTDDDHALIEAQTKLIGAIRFRPEEVAASAVIASPPSGIHKIQPISDCIEKELTSC